jgi:pSer/pThr/pTyr-binding forkhead associated (FHA) protein
MAVSLDNVAKARECALRVANWLVEKSQPDDAVALLSVWAAKGPNDAQGQALLAEALRIDPSAKVAQEAFEQMEGVSGEHAAFEQAWVNFGPEQLNKLEAELRRPTFRRAQMGFNNNIKYQEHLFHVQTEDSGLDQPHIITHLFADGGRVIKSHKRSYAEAVSRADVAEYVRSLMKAQHLEMVLALREAKFDEIIAGRAVGGIEVLVGAPSVDAMKIANKRKQRATINRPLEAQPVAPVAESAEPLPLKKRAEQRGPFLLHVLRSLAGGPDRYAPKGDTAVIGAEGDIQLHGEAYCHPREAELSFKDGHLWLEDLDGGNGVFLRIRRPVELDSGDEFVVGDQLLRIDKNPLADDGPDPAPTYFYSSPKWPSSFRVTQMIEGGIPGACSVARGKTLQVGSAIGDMLFPEDPLLSEQHCVVEEQAGSVVLSDLGSRTGVFVRIRGEQELAHGDELLIGRTRLVVDLAVNA